MIEDFMKLKKSQFSLEKMEHIWMAHFGVYVKPVNPENQFAFRIIEYAELALCLDDDFWS